jgi:phenylacetate-CoA ligase
MIYLIEKAPEIIGANVGELGIRTIMCGGEPGAGLPDVRQRIESAYGCRLFDVGAALGVSCAHEEYQGMHQVGDDFMIFELVDPDSKEPLPFEHGQRGEAVYTTIDGGALGRVRHSMGDIMEIYTEPCPCGLSGFRYKVVGRTDDMLKVKGTMVYPNMIRKVIESFVPRVTGQFRIVLEEPPPRVVPPLKLKVEHGEAVLDEKLNELAGEIADDMSQKIKVRPKIIWVKPGVLERSTYKGKVFEKQYENK